MDSNTNITDSLRRFPCLSFLEDNELSDLRQRAVQRTINKGDILFTETEPVKNFYLINNGLIKLYKSSIEGKELIINFLSGGDHFCLPFKREKETNLVSAVALEKTSLISLPSRELHKLLTKTLNATGIRIIEGLCNKIGALSEMVEDLAFRDVETRVLKTIFRLCEQSGDKEDAIVLMLTHQDIASMTGTVRELVSRVISKLKKEKIVLSSNVKGLRIDKRKLELFLSDKYPVGI